MSDPKFCKDCRFFQLGGNSIERFISPGYGVRFAICMHASALKHEVALTEYLVSGSFNNTDRFYCSSQRMSGCGHEAKYFEPKEPQ